MEAGEGVGERGRGEDNHVATDGVEAGLATARPRF
jgi:hypothetical protein